MNIKNVVVIGSGTMGSGIAAQLCNADIPVTILDLKTEISEKAKKRIYESKPPLLIDRNKINNIKIGNIDENFDVVKTADWIVEAVVERIDIKHSLYEKISKVRKQNSIISSNTSTIPLKVLSAKMSKEDKRDFCITHFFNPVRYMGLLPSASLGTQDKNGKMRSIYEPVHGSAPDIAGTGKANPIASILSFSMALRYSLDLDKEADNLDQAVQKVLDDGLRTKDILSKGKKEVSTSQMGDAIISKLK